MSLTGNQVLKVHPYFCLLSISILWIPGSECPVIPEIDNGFVLDPTKKYFYGDEGRIQCHKGFKLIGSSVIKCGPDQEFLNLPRCEGKLLWFPLYRYCLQGTVRAL